MGKSGPRANAVYICGPPEGAGMWDEPFIVNTDDGSHQCERKDGCPSRSRWMVEVVGWTGTGEPPYLHPVRYVCNRHVVAAMEELRG